MEPQMLLPMKKVSHMELLPVKSDPEIQVIVALEGSFIEHLLCASS